MENQEALRHEKIWILLFRYSIPAIIAMMVTSLYNVVDRAFIGSMEGVGSIAIAGLGVTMPVFTLIIAFGMLVSVGASTSLSIKLGEKNKKEAEKILGNALTLSIIISIIITVLGLVFLEDILFLLGASKDSISYAKDYMSVILLGTPFNLIAFSLNNAIRAEGNPKLAARTMIVGCILNLILDPIFIFVFNLGIKGAAIATVLCQVVVFIWVAHYFIRGKSNLKLKKYNLKLDINITKKIFAIGMTPFAMEVAISITHVLTNNSLKVYGGDLAIGAMTALTSILLMFMMPVFGLNQGMQTIISYNYGAKQFDRAKKTLILSILVSIVILSFGFLVVQVFPEVFVGIFNKDSNLMEIAVRGININLITLPIMGISIVGPVYFQCVSKVKHSMFLTLLRQFILFIPLIIVLPIRFNLDGVWLAQPIADFIAMIIVLLFLRREFKMNQA
ncbi:MULTISPECIES: MATE family efflux transporter [unclassified Clostridioides]|uniref:MATE family efflux transporter n=1 Tax=unclassified Clostridioides TaxID=2635829 RepID=UPI001D122B63|nr:MATE family efflux transporter [Clostridioides sp. ZZV14-6150]MCC0660757.1 MATE family efflux transporter [Clostridioides sp. ZZV14-6154]MCC0721481.1 MATE family efflux transporter [Clostridioides sp. ZZV14-6104]MCC0727888.1 MATE family efflux transporter [Clostridioides sp. ZZV14-6045]MCC0734418.1 MATE family efflux transporter [Clostridioides sp. ZZV14-6009]MCC0738061.1 MATE family efflux transporter [Clostridioides sp. ZZV14-5902]MCC0741910.1 MATE family efflux transporter [Clostridioid